MIPIYVLWLTAIFSALLSAAVVIFAYRRLYSKRLQAIQRMTQDLSKGNYANRLNIYTKDELSGLSRSLNELALQFEYRLKEITNDKEKLEAIFSSMVEGVIVVSANGILQHITPNVRQMLELRSPEVKDKLYWEIIWNQEINDAIKEALNYKKTVRKEIHIIGPQENFFNMQVSPVSGPGGEMINTVAVFHDITELKRLEKIRSEFVANVSHELKTPLTAIKGFVETSRITFADDPKTANHFLDIIAKQTQRLENLVNDLLILSSIESQEIKMEITPEPLFKIVQSVIQMQKNQIEQKGLQLKIDVPLDLPKIPVDRQRMEQVLINLIDNAIKFTPQGGKIGILAQKQYDFIRIDITDTGIGMEPQHLSRLFERFYRVDMARASNTGGTGLGLSIVKHIIHAHQGRISVASTPGSGSTFSIYLLSCATK